MTDFDPDALRAMIIAREAVAVWMIEHSYATGHGDTLDDLLLELVAQAAEKGSRPRSDD